MFPTISLNQISIGMWRYSRPVLRSERALQSRRWCTRHKLLVYGRFCRSWFLLSRNIPTSSRIKGKYFFKYTLFSPFIWILFNMELIFIAGSISRQNNSHSREPWITSDYSSLWVLWRVFAQIWKHNSVAILHRNFRLSQPLRHYWRPHFLCPRRPFTQHPNPWPNPHHRPQTRSPSWRSYVWFAMVWSRGHTRLGRQSQRCRVRIKKSRNFLHYVIWKFRCRYLFGSDVVAQFNQANDVDMICRAHQLVMEGYKWHFNETVLTVWSAPNYCYRCGNVAAILELDEHLARNFTIFEAAPQEARGVPCKKPQADYFL